MFCVHVGRWQCHYERMTRAPSRQQPPTLTDCVPGRKMLHTCDPSLTQVRGGVLASSVQCCRQQAALGRSAAPAHVGQCLPHLEASGHDERAGGGHEEPPQAGPGPALPRCLLHAAHVQSAGPGSLCLLVATPEIQQVRAWFVLVMTRAGTGARAGLVFPHSHIPCCLEQPHGPAAS